MIDLSSVRPGTPVLSHDGRQIASIGSIAAGRIRLADLCEWSPRDNYLDLTEVERTDSAGLHLKASHDSHPL